mmetsp:Transcript_15451/g.23322  ORF Transcript_15451/g.23322 Transcript_15451/m.23322 type:complete len:779 (+) Transcript_15451:122-2458(+)|eukprot:CAMPEP_0185036604 /NCGR_PEP_ID=MMETSP1103-20130426/29796_1 /TAXON_ID=36769 /ORGANISM="Paraphysomonas bandaiensis, Strain Caron Lab Isolate" /LENGTH=778 /DNA_ID=CAMNT_0027574199 /DNA_START=49 /DNA_END=2385 /DNA_ORIENTATION=+
MISGLYRYAVIVSYVFQLLSAQSSYDITTDAPSYSTGDVIIVSFHRSSDDATSRDWISITLRGQSPPSILWQYVCGGKTPCSDAISSGTLQFSADSLSDNDYDVSYFHNDGYTRIGVPAEFSVNHPNGDPTCSAAYGSISSVTHVPPVEGSVLSTIAFGSCYAPSYQTSDQLWKHLRETTAPDLWMWLGDNMYSDGTDMEAKRQAYNTARENLYYATHGPVAEPKIPVMGTWDDHDYAANNQGNDYSCGMQSQNEFVHHMGIDSTDPRHPAQGDGQRKGIYSSNMFARPASAGGGNGVHVIALDARSGRDPTFSSYGTCLGENTKMLNDEQWEWLEKELNRPSVVKVIASGTQVLPPTDQSSRSLDAYCAYDDEAGTFLDAIAAVGEDENSLGTHYESWGEIPQQRAKLLQLCQKAINGGSTQHIVFISGDQHWAEIMAKKMPASDEFGPSVVLHELTASGIDQHWNEPVDNSNRLRVRSADYKGDGVFVNECNFPFTYGGVQYNECTDVEEPRPWCSIQTSSNGQHVTGQWGYCLEEEAELVQKVVFSGENTCTDQLAHICTAQANYGVIDVDWEAAEISLKVFTPFESSPLAASHTISLYGSDSSAAPSAIGDIDMTLSPVPQPTPPTSSPTYQPCTVKPKILGNGKCNANANTAACDWDGGDCCEASCKANSNPKIVKKCGKKGYDCKDPALNTPFPVGAPTARPTEPTPVPSESQCEVQQKKLGNGKCDRAANTASCGWDGGDCCELSCLANPNPKAVKKCKKNKYDCQDPDYQ